jgi:Asp-tRNA(Asn)/Glu-tRNA(Gln) amidotransferase A subunit family amidase
MKKVMISQPMRGKTEQQIREERAAVVARLTADGYEVVDTVFPNFKNEGNIPLKYLAKALEAIADVDAVYFMDGWKEARGCRIEHLVCEEYGVKTILPAE